MKFSEAFDAMMAGKRISLPIMCSSGTFPPDWWLSLAQGEPSPATGGKSDPYIAEHKASPFRASGPDYPSVVVNGRSYIPDPCIVSLWSSVSFGMLSEDWVVLE